MPIKTRRVLGLGAKGRPLTGRTLQVRNAYQAWFEEYSANARENALAEILGARPLADPARVVRSGRTNLTGRVR